MRIEISDEAKGLITYIANIQIKALDNISKGIYQVDEEDVELMKQFQSSIKDIQKEARVKIEHFKDMVKEPLLIGITDDKYLSIMRHILFHIEEEYNNHHAVMQLWDIFFYIEKERHPELKLFTVKKNEHGKNNGCKHRTYSLKKR